MQKRWHGAELGQRGYLAELGQRGYLNSPSYLSTFSPFFLPLFLARNAQYRGRERSRGFMTQQVLSGEHD